jgi:serine/threonine-protein phosphatase PP1 catalytic subunit
MVQVKDEKVD